MVSLHNCTLKVMDQRITFRVERKHDGTEKREFQNIMLKYFWNVPFFLQKVTEDPKVLEELWVPDLEIYGLEHFGQKSVLKEMSGLRMWKDKTIEFNTR